MSTQRAKGFALSLLLLAGTGSAQVPPLIQYQGRLVEGTNLVNRTVPMVLALYTNSTGGSPVYADSNQVVVADGLYATYLGDNTVLGSLDAALREQALWLQIDVDGQALVPREPIAAVAYALVAGGVSNNAIGGAQVANGSLSAADLATNTFWQTAGNAGTSTGTHFVGTTDNRPLDFRVNNARALRLEPTATRPNFIAGASDNVVQSGAVGVAIGGGYQNVIEIGAEASVIGGGLLNTVQVSAVGGVIGGGMLNRLELGAEWSAVGGGWDNRIGQMARRSLIGGGEHNAIETLADDSMIGGGSRNRIGYESDRSLIMGGFSNRIDERSDYASLLGGERNAIGIRSDASVVAGGTENVIGTNSPYAVVGGGGVNVIGPNAAGGTIPGGFYNEAGDILGFALGYRAKARHQGAFVWGDYTEADLASTASNQFLIRAGGGVGIGTNVTPERLTVAGNVKADLFIGSGTGLTGITGAQIADGSVGLVDLNADVTSNDWHIGGNTGLVAGVHFLGTLNAVPFELRVANEAAWRVEPMVTHFSILGGRGHSVDVTSPDCVIAGGSGAGIMALSGGSSIGGGYEHLVEGYSPWSVIAGGQENRIREYAGHSAIGGGQGNSIGEESEYGVVAGGFMGLIADEAPYASVGGGEANQVQSHSQHAVVGGGKNNEIYNAPAAVIGGGSGNRIQQANGSVIAGGAGHVVADGATHTFIGGGWKNGADQFAQFAVVAGGQSNWVEGEHAMIPGGLSCEATNLAFAAGRRAKARHPGAFVWADAQDAEFSSASSNQFLIRAQGGVGINTTATPAALSVAGGVLADGFAVRDHGPVPAVQAAGLVSTGTPVTLEIPHFTPFKLLLACEWPWKGGVCEVTGFENDHNVAVTFTRFNGGDRTSGAGGAWEGENTTNVLVTFGSSNYLYTVRCSGEIADPHNLVLTASGLGLAYRLIY